MSGADVAPTTPADGSFVDEAFDLSAILHKAAVRHTSTVDSEVATAAAQTAMLRAHSADIESLAYVEGNIRAWAEGQEALERRTVQRLWNAHYKGITRLLVLRADAEEGAARNQVEAEAYDTIDALCHRAQAMHADALRVQIEDMIRGEGNVRVATAAAELRDWCAMQCLSDDLLEDLHDVAASSSQANDPSPGSPMGDAVTEARWHEDTRRLLLLEANLRFTIEMEFRRHWVAVNDVHESLLDEASPASSPKSNASHASPRALRFDSPTTDGRAASPLTAAPPEEEPMVVPNGASTETAARPPYPRYCRPVVSNAHTMQSTGVALCNGEPAAVTEHNQLPTALPNTEGAVEPNNAVLDGATIFDLNLHGVPQWFQEDIAAERHDVEETWALEWRTLYDGLRSYIALEYDWVLAGWRRVVRSDQDMFKRQVHVPASLRSPQKHLFHGRLGLLERCVEDVLLSSPPHGTSGDGGGSPSAISLQHAPQRSPPHTHRPTPPRESASTPRAPPQRAPQRAVNDSLLQSLLYQEQSNRGLIARDFEAVIRRLGKAHEADLHRELNWSRGWCVTENARRALLPAAVQQRHLPASYRGITDPRPPPTHSARPPVLPSVASSAKKPPAARLALGDDVGTTDLAPAANLVLCLPVPPAVLQRAKSASHNRNPVPPQH